MNFAKAIRANILYPKIYDLFSNKLRHRLWPTRLHSRAYNWNREYKHLQKSTLVNVGAGPYFNHPNWISLDMIPHFSGLNKSKKKIYCNLLDCLSLFPINDLDAVYISHCLEHFKIDDAIRLLKSIKKSMRQGAYIRIVVPSFSLILEKLRNNSLSYFNPLFGEINSSDFMLQDILYALCSPSPKSRVVNGALYRGIRDDQSYEISDSELLTLEDHKILEMCNTHSFSNNDIGSHHLSTYTAASLMSILSELGFAEVYESHFMQSSFGPMRESPLFDGTHPWMSLYIEARL